MNRRAIGIAGSALGLILGGVLLTPAFSHAQDSLGFIVSPPLRELSVNPNQQIDETLDVTNTSASAVMLYPLAKDFEASSDPTSSSPQILETTPKDSAAVVSPWIHFTESSLSVAAGHTESLHYTIAVPADAAPGGHFGGVFITTQQPTDTQSNNVGIETRVGSLLLLTVSGKTTAAANPVDFTAIDAAGNPNALFQSLPVQLRATIANTGNVHLQPSGTVVVTNMFHKQVLSQDFNTTGSRILPGSQHAFTQKITDAIGWGRFTATANLVLKATDGSVVPMTLVTTFWLLPLTYIIAVIVLLAILIIFFRLWLIHHDHRVQMDIHHESQNQK